MRIASLLPAATEIAAAVGLLDDLVAVTFECDHPAGIRDRVPVVVDTALPAGLSPGEIDAVVRDRSARGLPMYEVDADALGRLRPELILTQDLCRVCALPAGSVADALALIGSDAEVLSIDPHSVDDVLAAIVAVGHRGGAGVAADALVGELRERLAAVERAVAGRPRPRVLVLEWTDPPFLAGHWVPELVRRAGGEPVGGVDAGRSTTVDWADLPAADVVVVAPCGYGLPDALAQAAAVRPLLPAVPVLAMDSASYVVRAGPRLVDGIEALAGALHPDAVAPAPPGRIASP
ncbi:ABC transporter substrate-binding protein [Pseudonocardia abyssalis]|uniref:Cobalamin-binding protein n=1 Tax=Pseudonocardia abyssalis TaxID=2792008 RepID=A0ABS6UQZ8_9PSEU|nr:cobalamin-binding protein [Pseudonocardia abyssalis]MBW0114971.1 cobalamin-binding protein [Pseudonocardia abyssalis]MBW0134640.1 cobalamin-binding protein [Pseudonocardia abyssalis]